MKQTQQINLLPQYSLTNTLTTITMNNGQTQQSTRWYRFCFIPTISDSSDESDTESVVIAPNSPTQTSTWHQPSTPRPPSNPEPEFNRLSPPLPPPPPPPFLTSPPLASLQFQFANQEPQINRPPPPSIPESQINWNFPPPPPPPFFLRSPSLLSQEFTTSNLEHSSDDQSELLRIPDSVINVVHIVRISELNKIDEFSQQCPICMEEFKVGDQACRLPCSHTYKFICILRWLNFSKTCPVCRLQLDGFEGQGRSFNIGDDDDDSLDLESQISPDVIINNTSLEDLFQFSPRSRVTEDGAGENSDDGDYESACDELGVFHGERIGSN